MRVSPSTTLHDTTSPCPPSLVIFNYCLSFLISILSSLDPLCHAITSLVSPHSFIICFSRKGEEQTIHLSASYYLAPPLLALKPQSVPSVLIHCCRRPPVSNGSICWFMLPFGLIDNHPPMLSVSQLLTHYWSFVGFPLPPLLVRFYPLFVGSQLFPLEDSYYPPCFTSIIL